MNTKNQIKILVTACGLFVISTAYALIQNKKLHFEIDNANRQCELRADTLLKDQAASPQPLAISTVDNASKLNNTPSAKTTPKTVNTPVEADKPHLKDQPKLQNFSESLQDIVKRKYRFMLSTLKLTEQQLSVIIELLLKREQLALDLIDAKEFGEELGLSSVDVAELQYEIEQIDQEIADLLNEQQQEKYTLLKDSDNEQKEFSHFSRGITGLFPLNPEQQETVLFSKLKRKQQFEAELEAMGFNMDFPLSQEQKQEQTSRMEQFAKQYMEDFLSDVKPHVDHSSYPFDQYTLLENYTKTEFKQLMERLNKKIEDRGVY